MFTFLLGPFLWGTSTLKQECYCSVVAFNAFHLIFKHFIEIHPLYFEQKRPPSFACKFQRDHYMSFHNEPFHVIIVGKFSLPPHLSVSLYTMDNEVSVLSICSFPLAADPILWNLVCSCDRCLCPVKSLQR